MSYWRQHYIVWKVWVNTVWLHPSLNRLYGSVSPASLPFGGKDEFIFFFFYFLGDSLLPAICLILSVPPSLWLFIYWEDLSLLPFLFLLQAGLNTRKAHSPLYCPVHTELYHLTGILPSTFRFWHGLLLPFSFSVTCERMFFPVFLRVSIWK